MFGAFFTDWHDGDRLVGVLVRDITVGHSNLVRDITVGHSNLVRDITVGHSNCG
jgi:hypothetical protein